MKTLKYDFIVVGSGLAGLLAAFHASDYGSVALISKSELDISNSYNAQGGIAVAIGMMIIPNIILKIHLKQDEGCVIMMPSEF